MLSNAYFVAKFRFDTAENEPAKNLQNFARKAGCAAQLKLRKTKQRYGFVEFKSHADAVAALKKKQGAVVDDRVVRALEGTKYLCFGVGLCQVLQTLTNTYSSWKHYACV